MLIPPPPSMPYHRLARTAAHRWWRPVLGTLFIAVAGVALTMGVFLVVALAALIAGQPEVDGIPSFGELTDLAVAFLSIAVLLPVVLLAALWIQRRPPGTLSSVTGRLRWRWLMTCLPVAFVAIVLFVGAGLGLTAVTGQDTGLDDSLAGWGPFAVSMLVLLLVVPGQAAAEEYLTRGWLLQAFGTWLRSPWLPIAVQALVFAALHGWGTAWGFADLLLFGVVAGWLTVRTGGLEAAIALHVMNNLVSSVVAAAYGELGMDQTAADMPWQMAVADVPVLLGYAAVILWLARRRNLATLSPATPFQVPTQPAGTWAMPPALGPMAPLPPAAGAWPMPAAGAPVAPGQPVGGAWPMPAAGGPVAPGQPVGGAWPVPAAGAPVAPGQPVGGAWPVPAAGGPVAPTWPVAGAWSAPVVGGPTVPAQAAGGPAVPMEPAGDASELPADRGAPAGGEGSQQPEVGRHPENSR
ncbi:CPBP family glutamic-type intramembrane protease [Actinoplanes sp. NPDC024001]|uniref:CPBP family glutamic-type intramembrane protease n=1 Tax=Actinoplanes sp. NPDC024001 TaxID=3154598 RepID=UPI0033DF1F72